MAHQSTDARNMNCLQACITHIKRLISSHSMRFPQWPSKSTPHRLERPPDVLHILANRTNRLAYTTGDFPLAVLYRMYEYVVLDSQYGLRNEMGSFFHHAEWPVHRIPDPKDPCPDRYAILAVLTEFLVKAFNRNIAQGIPRDRPPIVIGREAEAYWKARPKKYEEIPKWAKKVPRLKELLVITGEDGEVPNVWTASLPFLEKNIVAFEPHIYFV